MNRPADTALTPLPRSRAAFLSPARALWARAGGFLARLWRSLRRLDDHWLGDLLGAISLFGTLYLLLFIGWVVSS